MKRNRHFVQSCDCCQVRFESNSSFIRHCKTQGHRHNELGAQNAAMMLDEGTWENDCASTHTTVPLQQVCPPQPHMAQPTVLEDMTEAHEESEGEIFSETSDNDASAQFPSEELEFFPFPDEKFFLLYCYAHGIMRPKVSIKCRIF